LEAFLDRHQDRGWRTIEDLRGIRRDRVVPHSQIKRPDAKEYFGGHDVPEGYAEPQAQPVGSLPQR
jgi:hypothetical protein